MKPAEAPELSIVMVNWNALEHLRRALRSLHEWVKSARYEVVVVDNASTKGRLAETMKQEFPWVSVIENPENRGFAAACNQGIEVSNGRYVLLLNTDTLQIEDAPGKALQFMEQHPEVGVLGIRHLRDDPERSVQPSTFDFPNGIRYALGALGIRRGVRWEHPSHETDVDGVCGSFLLIRRRCLEEIGGLDERYFVYEEDADWCKSAWAAGWRVRYWPGAAIVHRGASAREHLSDKSFMHLRSLVTYFRKNASFSELAAFYLATSLTLAAGTARHGVGSLTGSSEWPAFVERLKRQLWFMTLRHSRRGIAPDARA